MSHASFEPDYTTMSLSGSKTDEEIDYLQEQVDSIRDHLVFDDDTEETIAIVGGRLTHNVITLSLKLIASKFGNNLTNSILVGFGLKNVGW